MKKIIFIFVATLLLLSGTFYSCQGNEEMLPALVQHKPVISVSAARNWLLKKGGLKVAETTQLTEYSNALRLPDAGQPIWNRALSVSLGNYPEILKIPLRTHDMKKIGYRDLLFQEEPGWNKV